MSDPRRDQDLAKPERGEPASDFARQAEESAPGVLREFYDFLDENKKWWLTPIIVVLLLVGLLVLAAGTGFAPFIYTLF